MRKEKGGFEQSLLHGPYQTAAKQPLLVASVSTALPSSGSPVAESIGTYVSVAEKQYLTPLWEGVNVAGSSRTIWPGARVKLCMTCENGVPASMAIIKVTLTMT